MAVDKSKELGEATDERQGKVVFFLVKEIYIGPTSGSKGTTLTLAIIHSPQGTIITSSLP
ncbi:uncharacterized protein G2W53_024185 [Senna tora]|uniref:Uncharacterized protein n=1 Tax=Senna tora TaxID=362788 RepID=A0A834TBM4_9FABA|nr:uncharacterized protein G2W53_024185 [Senna tora]